MFLTQETLLHLAWYMTWYFQSDNFQIRSLLLLVNKCLAQYCTDIDSGERDKLDINQVSIDLRMDAAVAACKGPFSPISYQNNLHVNISFLPGGY